MTKPERYPELDWLRGIAVIAMIAFHLCFDLSVYYGFAFDVTSGASGVFARGTACIFLMLIGICFVISWERTARQQRRRKYAQRAFMILCGGMIISLVTWIVDPSTFVVFGILHLISVSTVIQYVLRPLKRFHILLGTLISAAAFVLPTTTSIETSLLLPLGIMPQGFASVDYYPLLPWLGPVLIGMGLGDALYIPRRRTFLSCLEKVRRPRILLWIGRKALVIYFIHQPVILLLLWMILGR